MSPPLLEPPDPGELPFCGMRKKKSERTIVPLPPTSNSEHQPLPNYANGVVGGYSNTLTNNAVTISNQNQFSSNNHTINVHGQAMSPAAHAVTTSHPSHYGGHNENDHH